MIVGSQVDISSDALYYSMESDQSAIPLPSSKISDLANVYREYQSCVGNDDSSLVKTNIGDRRTQPIATEQCISGRSTSKSISIYLSIIDPKIFLKTPLAPIYTNFDGESAPKKNAIFLSTFFKKCPKTAFWTVFSIFCLRRRKFCRKRDHTMLRKSSKINSVDLEKKSHQNVRIFLKIRPPPSRKS